MAFTIDNRKYGMVLVYKWSNYVFRYHDFFSLLYLSSIIYTAIIINYTFILDLYFIQWYLFLMKEQRLTTIFITLYIWPTYYIIVYFSGQCIFLLYRRVTNLLSPRCDLRENSFKREVIVRQLKFKIPIYNIFIYAICNLYWLFIPLLDTD